MTHGVAVIIIPPTTTISSQRIFITIYRPLFVSPILHMFMLMQFMLQIFLSSPLDRTLIIRIETHSPHCIMTKPLSVVFVRARAGGRAVFEEEVEEFVFDGEVGFLAELLEGGEFEEHFEEGEGGFDW